MITFVDFIINFNFHHENLWFSASSATKELYWKLFTLSDPSRLEPLFVYVRALGIADDNSWFVVLTTYVALAIFQLYRDLEVGDNQSLES